MYFQHLADLFLLLLLHFMLTNTQCRYIKLPGVTCVKIDTLHPFLLIATDSNPRLQSVFVSLVYVAKLSPRLDRT